MFSIRLMAAWIIGHIHDAVLFVGDRILFEKFHFEEKPFPCKQIFTLYCWSQVFWFRLYMTIRYPKKRVGCPFYKPWKFD